MNIKHTKDVLYREKYKYAKAKIYILEKKQTKQWYFSRNKSFQMIIIVWRIGQNSHLPKTQWAYTYAYLKDSKEIFQETNY